MSVQTLYTAATGMEAMQTKLDVIANNLANVNTTGFQKDRANFEDLFYRTEKVPGAPDANGTPTPAGIQIGLGTRVTSVQTDFRQGALLQTGRNLDIAVQGRGFLQVVDPASGDTLYTRAGHLDLNAQGQLVVGSANVGRLIEPAITIPPDATEISIGTDGSVDYRTPGSDTLSNAGQLQLATFVNPDGLLKLGDTMYAATDASGTATPDTPGVNGLGQLRQGVLEASNVEPVQELIDLITTQRSFELNSQTVQAGDQILQLISNLRRF